MKQHVPSELVFVAYPAGFEPAAIGLEGTGSVPDARISADFTYLFEVKTARGTVDEKQLRAHLKALGEGPGQLLFVLTPDATRPPVTASPEGQRVVWFNFAALHDAITAILDDALLAPSELDRFLLRELQALFDDDGLLTTDEVVIVAAGLAYAEYLETGAYIRQSRRSFRDGLAHMGFYAQQAIQPETARIEAEGHERRMRGTWYSCSPAPKIRTR
ncbi:MULTISPECIES: hypothetical protein [unclassified Nocardiopsis]|uniref:hypothetical protein n=1 Tax=unclassified Nocardiopsis TaxID=2649073 RepID=UPI00093AE594|nr:hypothetical protein [Nocardiopsis sp. TSRI0078]